MERGRQSGSSGRSSGKSSGRPASGAGRPSSSDRRPASGAGRPSSSDRRPRADETSSPSGRPVYGNTGRPSSSDRRPASGAGRSSYSDRSSSSDRRPASGAGRSSYSDRPSSSDRRPASGAGRSSTSSRPPQRGGDTWERPPLDRPRRAKIHEPNIPPEVTGDELDRSITRELSTLSPANAKVVAQHLVAAGLNLDANPKLALEHARAAVYHAGRIAAVRESLGIAAYMCGEFAEALSEFRAAMRISGDVSNWSMMADCERGLGRPEKALAMAGAPEATKLDKAGQIELRIVAAGARQDMGQLEAALVTLTCPELNTNNAEWSGRLRYAYADALLASGREEEALTWFQNAAASDPEQLTDAVERIDQLNGISFDLDDEDDLETELEVEDQIVD
ncbi:MAG TPA: hypothetical protein VMV52_03230 [Candidatus Nanopelagicaceae bacterium]|nr:hypothetical protein [Candidatus Nanopelagicaceae bacterium]